MHQPPIAPENQSSGKKNQWRIENLPEATRKKILIVTTTAITIALIVLWAKTFGLAIKTSTSQPPDQELSQLLEKAQATFGQINQQLEQVKQVVGGDQAGTSTATTTSQLTNEELEKLKAKILDQQNSQATTAAQILIP